MIRPNTTDPEYLDNWVQKLDLLCESKERLGLLGSSYFVGILIAMIFIPQLSDSYGRRNIFIFTMAITLISEVGLIFSHSMNLSALFMVLLGFAFPGKNIVGLNYLLEFTPLRLHTKFVTTKMVCECLLLYLMSKGYE